MSESATSFHPVLDRDLRTLKSHDSMLVEHPSGMFTRSSPNGLYKGNCRYIAQSRLLLNGSMPVFLDDYLDVRRRVHRSEFTNPEGWMVEGEAANQGVVFISREKELQADFLLERITCRSYAYCPISCLISVCNLPDFADMFEIRSWLERRERGFDFSRDTSSATWTYHGTDGLDRRLRLTVPPECRVTEEGAAEFQLDLKPGEKREIELTWELGYGPVHSGYSGARSNQVDLVCPILTNSERVNLWLERATEDLSMLITETTKGSIPYAGLPWFAAPFGRDALWVGLSTVWLFPQISADILNTLAETQSNTSDPSREAEPGKIIHEFRISERTLAGDLPFDAYYGAVDGTSLFLILAYKYYRRTGDEKRLLAIASSLSAAADWLIKGASLNQIGLLTYFSHNRLGLTHQGWRDAEDAYFNAEGEVVEGRLSLVEAQAYRLAALRAYRRLLRFIPDPRNHEIWLDENLEDLRVRFDHHFWWEEEGFYYPALDEANRALPFMCSTAGHVLWSQVASQAQARSVTRKLFDSSFWSGWGVRTVAKGSVRYNPLSYHNGGCWPHDTAIAAAGAARYGNKEPARRVFQTLGQVAISHPLARLPELFSGLNRQDGQRSPLRFATACSPQAWAVVVPFLLLQSLLGLELDARSRTLSLHYPELPENFSTLELRGLHLHEQSVELRISREGHSYAVQKLSKEGSIDLRVRC